MSGLLLLGLLQPGGPQRPAEQAHRRISGPDGPDALVIALDAISEDSASEGWAIAAALAQNAVLSAYAGEEDVLPVALGAAFSDEAALARHIAQAGPTLSAQMAALAGKTEYLFRLLPVTAPPDAAPEPPASGISYLRQRRATRDRRRHLGTDRTQFAETAQTLLAGHALDCVARPARSGEAVLDLSLLVPRAGAAALIEAARGLSERAGALGLNIRMVGPCAPHSFIPRQEYCDA